MSLFVSVFVSSLCCTVPPFHLCKQVVVPLGKRSLWVKGVQLVAVCDAQQSW